MPQLDVETEIIYCRSCNTVNEYYHYVTGPAESQLRCLKCLSFDIGTIYKPLLKNLKTTNICYCKSCDKQCMIKKENPNTKQDDFFCLACGIFQAGVRGEQKMKETIEFGSNCELCNRFCKDKCTCKSDRESQEFDIVEKPYHYNVGIEVDTFLDSWNMNHRQANIVKYVTRYPYKDPTKRVQDLKKARWYLDRLIEKEELREKKEQNASTK